MDLGFQIGFERPWFLLLLLLLPVMWALSFNSLAGLGKWRRLFALVLRTLVILLLIAALAKTQWQKQTDKLTVIYLLDQSDSIPEDKREFMLDYVIKEVNQNRRAQKSDMAGVIIFGGSAKIESAPYDGSLPIIDRLESKFDLKTGSTSLESALKLAKASFPEDTARRVVIISDGNENLGDSLSIAQAMAEDGIGIDVVPVALLADSEVSVEKLVIPSDIRKGQEFEAKVVIVNDSKPTEQNPDGNVTGTIRITRKTAQSEELVTEQKGVVIKPGKEIFGFKSKLDRAAAYTYDATFIPDDKTQDLIEQNNTASAFTHVRGKGKVLLIEDAFARGEFLQLIERLEANSIEVDTMTTAELYTSSAELLQYDSVILANLPRASGNDNAADDIQSFSDAQIKMLVDNCEHMGCGIVMIGGDRSFGAGGWANSELEKAMPVDFQIKNDKVSAVGALALVMHACELPNGNFWEVKVAEESIKILGPMDYCGVIEWGNAGGPRWLWKLPNGIDRVFQNRNTMLGLINRMTPGDMMDFQAPMNVMLKGLINTPASMKHAIIISDGDATPPKAGLLQAYRDAKIKISTVAIGTHGPAGSQTLKNIATATGGQYYEVKDPKGLPKIYQKEARRVAKPVIKESQSGMSVVSVAGASTHEILRGIKLNELPPFFGYVMTTVKRNNLVEQLALSSDPANDNGENSTLLATWRYGNGRTIAFTTDAGHKWTSRWFNDPQYDKLFVQIVRYSMRPITESANFTVSTEVKDGKARVVVTALDENEQFLNFLEIGGRGMSPGVGDFDLEFTQVGPGRYISETDVQGSGNFLFSIFPGEGYERLTAGVTVPYSSEYSDRQTNISLLDSLTKFQPKGGEPGMIIDGDLSPSGLDRLLAANTFRPTLTAALGVQNIWPLLIVICGTAFFADVFVRRVAVPREWAYRMLAFAALFAIAMLFTGIPYRLMSGIAYYLPWLITDVAQVFGVLLTMAICGLLVGAPEVLFRVYQANFTDGSSEQPRQSISRLQSRKAEIEKQIESRRASTKFEPVADDKLSGKQKLEEVLASEIEKTPKAPPKLQRDKLDVEKDTSYTSRLLDAKRKIQEQHKRNEDPEKRD